MRVTEIRSLNNKYYYNKKETSLTSIKSLAVREEAKIIETMQSNTYNTTIQNNSAEYVKHAYEVSFKPHDLILNLQEA
jgi:hypothetical protein